MNINKDSDFKLEEKFTVEAPFRFTYYISPLVAFVASFDGESYTNCRPTEEGIIIPFENHKLGEGSLRVRREFYLTDADFADGCCNLVSVENTKITLTRGKSDEVETTLEVYPNYQKGDKGDPFTYNDFTPEQLAGLKGETGNVHLISFDIVDGELFATIPKGGNLVPSINNQGELIITVTNEMYE